MPSEYTDAPRTRVMTPAALNNGVHENQSIGRTMAIAPKKKLFDDLSIPQIIAGAAAAATSAALASKIGIVGSVIGAAVSSVVTVVSSQVYRHFISAGAEAIKSNHAEEDYPAGAYAPVDADETARIIGDDGATTQMDAAGRPTTARVAPSKLQAKAAAERSQTQKRVILFSVAIAVAAVAICTGAILISTAGQGIGERPASVLSSTDEKNTDTDQTDATQDNSQQTPTNNGDGNAQSSDQSGQSGTASSGTANDSGQSGQQSGNSSSTDSGQGDSRNQQGGQQDSSQSGTDSGTGTGSSNGNASSSTSQGDSSSQATTTSGN